MILIAVALHYFPPDQLEADYGFASSVFASFASQTSRNSVQLHSPAFALSCYLAHSPQDSTALHLSALFCERLDQRALAISRIEQAASLLEAEYEKSEDAVTATKYAVAEANLARIRLANDDAEGAAEAFQATLGLLEAGESNSDADELLPASVKANVRLHAHFGTGLALYWTGDYAGALEAFETALAEIAETGVETESNADVRAHVAVLLAQVLWTMGSEEQREAAKSQLLDRWVASDD